LYIKGGHPEFISESLKINFPAAKFLVPSQSVPFLFIKFLKLRALIFDIPVINIPFNERI
jgi:hypothetical protein